MDELRRVDIDATYMIGQGYDGASSMSGSVLGVQACIRQVCPSAVYVHCASHCLNLTISRSCDIPSTGVYETVKELSVRSLLSLIVQQSVIAF